VRSHSDTAMSQWTHVAAVIRLRMLSGPWPSCNWIRAHFGKRLPAGSEGPLRIDVLERSYSPPVVEFTITVHGSLRDFGHANVELEVIADALDLACYTFGPCALQGVGQIWAEGRPALIWYFDPTKVTPGVVDQRTLPP
jgi:hypothetical protein